MPARAALTPGACSAERAIVECAIVLLSGVAALGAVAARRAIISRAAAWAACAAILGIPICAVCARRAKSIAGAECAVRAFAASGAIIAPGAIGPARAVGSSRARIAFGAPRIRRAALIALGAMRGVCAKASASAGVGCRASGVVGAAVPRAIRSVGALTM
jgi:hypothetical protein